MQVVIADLHSAVCREITVKRMEKKINQDAV